MTETVYSRWTFTGTMATLQSRVLCNHLLWSDSEATPEVYY